MRHEASLLYELMLPLTDGLCQWVMLPSSAGILLFRWDNPIPRFLDMPSLRHWFHVIRYRTRLGGSGDCWIRTGVAKLCYNSILKSERRRSRGQKTEGASVVTLLISRPTFSAGRLAWSQLLSFRSIFSILNKPSRSAASICERTGLSITTLEFRSVQ